MIYMLVALRGEAKPLLEHWSFKRNRSVPQRLYENDDMTLLVTQMGRENASSAVAALFSAKKPKHSDIVINFGLCAAPPVFPLGSVLQAGELRYKEARVVLKRFSELPVAKIVLETVDEAFEGRGIHAVDMEAYGVAMAAKGYIKTENMAFIKVVSDHFEPDAFEREEAVNYIREAIPLLEKLMEEMQGDADG